MELNETVINDSFSRFQFFYVASFHFEVGWIEGRTFNYIFNYTVSNEKRAESIN